MNAIIDNVRNFVSTEIIHGSVSKELDPELSLLEEGILDSLGLQRLITFLEQDYSVSIDDEDLMPENFESVKKIAELVARIQEK